MMDNVFDRFDNKKNTQNPFDQFDKSQDVGFFDPITGTSRMTPQMESLSEIGSAPELNQLSVPAFKASLGLLTTGDTESLKGILSQQLGGDVSFSNDDKGNVIVNLPSGQYALNKPGLSGQDVVRGAFDILSFTPAGRASTIGGAALKSGLTEAALGQTEESLGGEDLKLTDVATSSTLGAAGKGLEDIVGSTFRAIKGKPSQNQQELLDFTKEQNLPLMTTDVVEPKTFVGKSAQGLAEKVPLAGTGLQRAQQQEVREGLINKAGERFGGYSPSDVYDSLKRQTSKVKKAAGERLARVKGQVSGVDTKGLAIDKIDDVINDLTRTPTGELKSTADMQTVNALNNFKNDLLADPSFENLESLRTVFRETVKGDRMVMPTRTDAKIQSIYKSMTDDMYQTIEDSLGKVEAKKWQDANRFYAGEASKIKGTRLKSALDKGELTPEVVNNMLFSSKPSEVKILYNSLDSRGKEAARAGIMSKAVEQSNGSPDRFLTNLNKLSKNTGIVFKGDDRRYVSGIKTYLDATKQASQASIATPTGQQLFQLAPIAGAADIVTTGGAGTGAAALYGVMGKAYESKPIRDTLIKLNSIPKGSTEFEKALNSISELLQPIAQTYRREEDE